MNALEAVAERIGRNDMVQVLALYLAVLLVVLATRWPSAALPLNESWFALAPASTACLALIALGFGAHVSASRAAEQRVSLLALGVFLVAAVPFDVLTYAASYPATPLAWSLLMPLVSTPAFFGLGLGLGWLATPTRTRPLLPVLVPGLVAAGMWLDVRLGVVLFNPFTAAVAVSVQHAMLMTVLAIVTVSVVARRGRPPTERVA